MIFRAFFYKGVFLCLCLFSVLVLTAQDVPDSDTPAAREAPDSGASDTAAAQDPADSDTAAARDAPDSAAPAPEDFAVQISGEGDSRVLTITKYTGASAEVTIPETLGGLPVKAIGTMAFCRLDPETKTIDGVGLLSVVIPPGVEVIGDYAFYHNRLTHLEIPDGLTAIGDVAFAENALESLILPESLTSLGVEAFARNRLSGLSLPSGLKTLGEEGFAENRITELVIPQSLSAIENYAFAWNKLTGLAIPDNVFSIGTGAFAGNAIAGLDLPETLASIGEGAFSGNELVSLTIPAGVKTIAKAAFAKNKIETLGLPPSLEFIGEEAFMGNRLKQVNIPPAVAAVGEKAFALNPLAAVSIGADVRLARESFGNSFTAFYDSHAKSADVYSFSNGKWTYSDLPFSLRIDKNGDAPSVSITGYDGEETALRIPDRIKGLPVTAISEKALSGKGLTSVHIPAGVKNIGDYAFDDNPLAGITIGFGADFSDTAFGIPFYRYYYNNGRKAGVYLLRDGVWTSDFR
jgi:hypothetical protein